MAQAFNSKIKQVALAYKQLLKINITDSSLLRDIEENPFYPTLLSISDTFNRYNVSNAAYNVPTEQFGKLDAPFIALLSMPAVGSDFVLVTEITEDTVSCLYNTNKPQTIEKTAFIKRFNNIVLLAKPDENSGEKDFACQLKKERKEKNRANLKIATFFLISFLIIADNLISATALAYSSIAIIKLAGLSCVSLLVAYEIDKSNTFIKKLCGSGGKTNCDAVLESKAAKIWNISWSEIGLFYFSTTALVLFAPMFSFAHKTVWLSLFNTLAAPYIVFSIYYQWFVIKQWCPLCVTVQTILTTELIWSITYFWTPSHSFLYIISDSLKPLLKVIPIAFLPVITWYGIKPYLLKAKDYDSYKSAFRRLKNNPDIFHSLLIQQAKAMDSWENLGINLGNPDAPNTIIEVCSTSCSPCAEVFPKIEKIIKNNKNVNVKVIFTGNNDDHRAPVVRHLLAVATQNDILKTQMALNEWYLSSKQDYTAFAAKYPMNGELKMQNAKIDEMSVWCSKTEITHTPTTFVNGYLLPENYDIEDLIYIL